MTGYRKIPIGKYTYNEGLDGAAQAAVVMENYDTEFAGVWSSYSFPSASLGTSPERWTSDLDTPHPLVSRS
jgi:hypothetical protein